MGKQLEIVAYYGFVATEKLNRSLNYIDERIWVYKNPNWYSSKKAEGAQEVQGRSGVESEDDLSFV